VIHSPSDAELVGRIFLAVGLAGVVGLEREIRGHPAGLRTHITVAVGAVLFGLISAYGFSPFQSSRNATNYQLDPTRIASQVVVGIGFLGGGAIVKQGVTVKGLTTAASLWVMAAIGLGCAFGLYLFTLVGTGLLAATLVFLRRPVRWMNERVGGRETVVIRLTEASEPSGVIGALCSIDGVEVGPLAVRIEDDHRVVRAAVEGRSLEHRLAHLAERDDVVDLELT
jgi:putative Mg2+ transporter-C (MgtC) family protein